MSVVCAVDLCAQANAYKSTNRTYARIHFKRNTNLPNNTNCIEAPYNNNKPKKKILNSKKLREERENEACIRPHYKDSLYKSPHVSEWYFSYLSPDATHTHICE